MQNRIIKFRAWDGKEMHNEVQPYLWGDKPCVMSPVAGITFYEPTGTKRYWYEINVEAVMQYTGLKDKNGKEIYEGDVMRVLDRDWTDMEKDTKTFIVYYAKDSFILTTKVGIAERESDNPNQYNKEWIEAKLSRSYGRDRFEIIGNIYEHSHLLK